ncbi:MAG TPA: NeuD/PglB/VioB family sugar acetyltransferase [Chitinophagaceae bacterium]
MTEPLYLVGGGGHCRSCIEVIESTPYQIAGIIDGDTGLREVAGYPVIGDDSSIASLSQSGATFMITIGQVDTPGTRIKLFERIILAGGRLALIVDKSAFVSKRSAVADGTIVMKQAVINAGAVIGKNCIINNMALVEHDCRVGDHTHISTGAIVNGNVTIGTGVFVGSQAVIIHGITVGDGVVVGAGAVVINDLHSPGRYAGNPARKI